MWARTDIAPNRHHDVYIVVPDGSVNKRDKVINCNPNGVTPYRRTKLANLGYERQEGQDSP